MSDLRVDRRDFIAGFAASLGLLFAPWDQFVAWLEHVFTTVRAATGRQIDAAYAHVRAMSDILKAKYSQVGVYRLVYAPNPVCRYKEVQS